VYRQIATLLIATLIIAIQPASAAQNNSNAMANVFKGMITGLSLLGQANNTPSMAPSPYFIPGAYPGMGNYSQSPYSQQPYPQNQPMNRTLSEFQGSWEIDNGKLLIVKGNMARLYLSADRYQDLHLQANTRFLWMRPDGTQTAKQYEHRIFSKRAILRDDQGRQLLLQRYQQKPNR